MPRDRRRSRPPAQPPPEPVQPDVDVLQALRDLARTGNDNAKLGALRELARIEATQAALPESYPEHIQVTVLQVCPVCGDPEAREGARTRAD
jgi:hypothetical protein